jgi:hypothetical protein
MQKSCRDTPRTFAIISIRSLARRGRSQGRLPAKFLRRGSGGWRRSGQRALGAQGAPSGDLWGEGMAGSGVPTAAEAAAEGSSSARGFPVRKRAKLELDSCSRGTGSGWGGWIERRKGGGKGSTTAVAYRRGGDRRRGSSGGGPATGSGLGASVK